MRRVTNPRCRLACLAYITRFEVVLDSIERDGYMLRPAYPERKQLGAVARAVASIGSEFVSRHRHFLDAAPAPVKERSLRNL